MTDEDTVERVAQAIHGAKYDYLEGGFPRWNELLLAQKKMLRQQARAAIAALPPAVPELARHQPCGCIVCQCESDERCGGCGAKNCGTHAVGAIPNPVYATTPDPAAGIGIPDHIKDALSELPDGVWETWTSCSFRRISRVDGGDGDVLHALTQRSDGHPDLSWTEEQCDAICAIMNWLRALTKEGEADNES